MEKLKQLINTLLCRQTRPEQVEILQQINALFLNRYMLRIDNRMLLYPIEVEAYFYCGGFEDRCVHRNEIQRDHFGCLYFHRRGRAAGATLNFERGGIDVCLSTGPYFLSLLIRSARINDEPTPVCGPTRLQHRVIGHLCNHPQISRLTPAATAAIHALEREPVLLPATDDRRLCDRIWTGSRIGIAPQNHPDFYALKLRSLIELKLPGRGFREKEKIVASSLEGLGRPATEADVLEWLGYRSRAVLARLNG